MPFHPKRGGKLLSKLSPLTRHWCWVGAPSARSRSSRSLKRCFGSGHVILTSVEIRRVVDLQACTPFHGGPVERRGDLERAAVRDGYGGPDRIAVLHLGSEDFGAVDADRELDFTHGKELPWRLGTRASWSDRILKCLILARYIAIW